MTNESLDIIWELACPHPHLLPWHYVPPTPLSQALSGTFDNQELKKQSIGYLNCKAEAMGLSVPQHKKPIFHQGRDYKEM